MIIGGTADELYFRIYNFYLFIKACMKGFILGCILSMIIYLICHYTPIFSSDGLTYNDRLELKQLLNEVNYEN